jgi:hypothetical protein
MCEDAASSGELATNYASFFSLILLYKIYYSIIRSCAKKFSRQISNFMFYGSNLRVLISANAHKPVYCDIQVAYLRAPLVML